MPPRRSRQSTVLGARRAGILGPRQGTAEAALRGRLRRASASRASTADSVCDPPTSGRSTPSARCYEMPLILNIPTFTICAATILDMGSEDAEARTHLGRHPRRRDPGAAAERTQRRFRPRRCHHPRRPPGRQMDRQRRQDLEHQCVRRRLRAAAGPHRLERAQARGPDDVPGAARTPPVSRCAASRRSTAPRSSARSSSTTSNSATTPSWARSTRAGKWRPASSFTNAARSAAARSSPAASAPRTPVEMPPDHVGLAEATGQGDDPRVPGPGGPRAGAPRGQGTAHRARRSRRHRRRVAAAERGHVDPAVPRRDHRTRGRHRAGHRRHRGRGRRGLARSSQA